jgi:hypothetical protein
MQAFRNHSPSPSADTDFPCRAEPTIGELLADPLTCALMRADRIDAGALEHMLREVAVRVRADREPTRSAATLNMDADDGLPVPSFLPRNRVSEPLPARSLPGTVAAMASRIACGSHCAW